jgi:hypothetical protein
MTSTSPELKNIRDILHLERESLGEPSVLDDVASCDPHVEQFRSQTDIHAIAAELETERAAAASWLASTHGEAQ